MNQPDIGRHEDARFRRLAAAQMLQALVDLYLGSPRQRESVRNWLAGKSEDGFTFELCCKLLQGDSDPTRRETQAYYRQAFSIAALAMIIEQQQGLGPSVVNVSGGRQ